MIYGSPFLSLVGASMPSRPFVRSVLVPHLVLANNKKVGARSNNLTEHANYPITSYPQNTFILPNVGNMLKNYYSANRVNKAALARRINRTSTTVQKFHTRRSLQCNVLWDISVALQHNFFADIAAQLPQSYSTNLPETNDPAKRIAQLEEENKTLTSHLELLKEIMSR